MLNKLLGFMGLVGFFGCACAGSLKESFGGGVLGVPWGTTLTQVVGIYPQGDNLFALTPGCRAYWVKDGQPFLGIPRERSDVLFGFDKQDRVAIAAVAFEYERRDELHSMLISLLGAPTEYTSSSAKRQYGWRSSDGMPVWVTVFGQGSQQIVWLAVAVPGYRAIKDGC